MSEIIESIIFLIALAVLLYLSSIFLSWIIGE